MTKLQAMKRLWRDVCACQECGLAKHVKLRVFGDGNLSARIMLVGEAPGMDEDKTGHPFVGNAGQILRKCLLAAGINPRRIFIANVLKCHPPKTLEPPAGNRKPSVREMESCLPFLEEQLEIIDPKIIVALGNTAGTALLRPEVKKVEVTKMFGRTFDRHGRTVIITYHPQYLGYRSHDPLLMRDYVALFKKIKQWR